MDPELDELRRENDRLTAEARRRKLVGVPKEWGAGAMSSVERLASINAALNERLRNIDEARRDLGLS